MSPSTALASRTGIIMREVIRSIIEFIHEAREAHLPIANQ
jgi:hypothetical protein